MNKIYDNDFKIFFKYAKEIKEIPPIPKNFNTKHLQDFINEFESVKQENEQLKDKIDRINKLLNEPIFEYDNIPCNIENEIIQLKDILKEN